jgi:methylated-DNA-[protein]-cysteine S-methyltransferase
MTPTEPAAQRGNHRVPEPDPIDNDIDGDIEDIDPDVDDATFEAGYADLVGRLAETAFDGHVRGARRPRERQTEPTTAAAQEPPGSGSDGGKTGESGLDELLEQFARRAEADDLLDVAWTTTDSPVGTLTLAATPLGLVRVGFGTDDEILEELAEKVSPRVLEAPRRLDAARRQLDEYFAGARHRFDLPLDWGLSRGFRQEVLRKLTEVPYGQVLSYKELAIRAGNPNAVRATGTAMATNPIPLVVPCHRVVRSGGVLGNYGGGVDAKVLLLQLEGAPVLRRR